MFLFFPLLHFHIWLHNEYFAQNARMANWHAGGLCSFTSHRFKKPVNYIRAPVLSWCERVLISNAALTPGGFIVDV